MSITQQIIVNVAPGAPNTGLAPASPLTSDLFSITNPIFIIGVFVLLAGIVLLIHKMRRNKTIKQKKGFFFSIIAIIGVCSATMFAASTVPSANIRAAIEPTVTLSHDSLVYSLQPSGSGDFEFDVTVTTDAESLGYKMLAVSDNTNKGIKLVISDKDSEDKIVIPSAENDPVIIRESDENAATGHTAGHTIYVSLDNSVAPGSYTMNITYTVEAASLPAGSNPSNISSRDPRVLDVYPTTGWEGDVIAITDNGLFTNVESVTIGGTPCASYNVVSSSVVACKLPAKAAGTSNEIVVMNNGTNVTDASTYTHMKITYFDPSSNTVNIGGTDYTFYPDGFTSANCSTLTPSNDGILSTPASSMVYVRDTRNNQTYKVKKMVDNKCWMVDNLKYIDAEIENTADGTTGMVYNDSAYNTVDGSFSNQSDANFNKAFYKMYVNSTHIGGNCYGLANTLTNTLTHCGYLYNWYAATGGTGTFSENTAGTNVTGNICPANFRLPSSSSDGITATSNGTSYAAADFAVLNASMNAGFLTTGSTNINYLAGWQPLGAWGGVTVSHYWDIGDYWSSTVSNRIPFADILHIRPSLPPIGVYVTSDNYKHYDGTVRCVME